MDELDALLNGRDESVVRNARQKLLENSHDPAVRDFLDAEARMALHRDRVKRQAAVVDKAMAIAERDVSHLVTTKWIHQAGNMNDRLVSTSMHFGPQLQSVTADARVQECMKMLLGGTPDFVDDVNFIAQMSTFAHPTESIDSACVAMQKLLTEAYGTSHELTACVNPQHAAKLIGMVNNGRRVYASLAQLVATVHGSSQNLRKEVSHLQGQVEVLHQHRNKLVRVGREVMKENEVLRRQLFRAAVAQTSQADNGAEDANAATLGEKGVELQKQFSTRVVVLFQAEGCHELRFKQPTLVSQALLVFQSVVEATTAAHAGTRINYNPLHETREHFNRASNRRFATESYAFSFATAGAAFLCASELHDHLARVARWPTELLELPQFAPIATPEGRVVWQGIKMRAGIHQGVPFVSYPLAELDDAGKAGDNTSTHAMTSIVPYYGGLTMEKAMLLLQKTRAGETLATLDVTKQFERERFAKPDLSSTLSVVERPLVGLQVGFTSDEKIYSIVPRALEARMADTEPLTYNSVVDSVFPTATFWRQIDQSNEFSPNDFEDDQHRQLASTALLPHQYEEKIAALQDELARAKEHAIFLNDNSNRLSIETIRLAEELNRATEGLRKSTEQCAKMKQFVTKVPGLSRRAESAIMRAIDASLQRDVVIQRQQEELASAGNALEASVNEFAAFKNRRGEDEETNTDTPYPDVEVAVSAALAKVSRREAQTRADVEAATRGRCTSCDSLTDAIASVKSFVTTCADKYKLLIQADLTSAELVTEFNRALAVLLDPDWQEPEGVTDPKQRFPVTYDQLGDGTANPAKFLSTDLRGIVEAVANATRVVNRFAMTKALNQRMKGVTQSYGDELEFLMGENNRLESKLTELTIARRKDGEAHRDELRQTQLQNVKDVEVAEGRVEDLQGQVKRLTARLEEMTDRAQRFFDETCVLVNQLDTTKASFDDKSRVKDSFESLKEAFTPFVQITPGEKLLRDTNEALKRHIQVLEAKVKARESEMRLKDRFAAERTNDHELELELAREAAAAEERRLAEAELTEAIGEIERADRDKAAKAELERRKLKSEEELKLEHQRRQQEKKREELRAAREEFEREEWKRSQLADLVEAEVQKRVEQHVLLMAQSGSARREGPTGPISDWPIGLPPARSGKKSSNADGSAATPKAGTPSGATPPSVSPSAIALLPGDVPRIAVPASVAALSRQGSARTFVCASCSQKFMVRRPSSAAAASAAAAAAADSGRDGRDTCGDGSVARRDDAAATHGDHNKGVDVQAQAPSRPPSAIAAAQAAPVTHDDALPQGTTTNASEGQGSSAAGVAAAAAAAGAGAGAGGRTVLSSNSSETQTIISVAPDDRILPVASTAAGLTMYTGAAAAAAAQNPAASRPVMLRAIAVGEGYIIVTNDAASCMEEVWLQDRGTQSDIQAAPATTVDPPATTPKASTPKATTPVASRTTSASSLSAASKRQVGSAEALRKAVTDGRTQAAPSPAQTTPTALTAAAEKPEVRHFAIQTELAPVSHHQASPAPAAAGPSPPLAAADALHLDLGNISASSPKVSSAASPATQSPATRLPRKTVMHEYTQTIIATRDFGALVTPALLHRMPPSHVGVQCELLTDRLAELAAQHPGITLAEAMMISAATRNATREAASPSGIAYAKAAPSLGIASNARAALASGRLASLRGGEAAVGRNVTSEVDEYLSNSTLDKPPVSQLNPLRTAGNSAKAKANDTSEPEIRTAAGGTPLFGKNPRHAMERRGQALVPMMEGQSGVAGPTLPPTTIARLMVGAERDLRNATHHAAAAVNGPRPVSPSARATALLTAQEYEFVDTSGLEPWRVGQTAGRDGARSPGRAHDDEVEDSAELLARFGLATRDEVSLRAVHLKTAPVTNKFDVKKKTASKGLIIGKASAPKPATPTTDTTPPLAK